MSKRQLAPPGGTGDDGSERGDSLRRLAALSEEQQRADRDQTGAGADQTAADSDQTASDADRDLSDRDRLASERDQAAADREQAASDEEFRSHPIEALRSAHDAGSAARKEGARRRTETELARSLVAEDRARLAAKRDETARQRDLTAEARDADADRFDQESEQLERKMASRGTALRTALAHARHIRAQAARNRARAADDRTRAARDRERAAEERSEALAALRRAHLDDLTGALRRAPGELALQAEIDRARRGDGRLVLAFADVDSLKEINNRDGHFAGDQVLQDVVAGIRSKIRSYEPVVRYGGDEFLCAISEVDMDQVEKRFNELSASLAGRQDGGTVSVGLAELRPEDSLPDLIERADAALLDARRRRPAEAD